MEGGGGRRKHALIGGLWLAASQVVPVAGAALLSIVAGRMLGPDLLGLQSLVAFVEAAIFSVLTSPLTFACLRSVAEARGRGQAVTVAQLNWWAIRAHYVIGFIGALLILVIALFDNGLNLWYLSALSSLATAAGWAHGAVLAGSQGWSRIGRERLVSQLLSSLIAIVAILLGGGIEWTFIGPIIASVWVGFRLYRAARPEPQEKAWRPPPGLWTVFSLLAVTELVLQVAARRSEFVIMGWLSTEREIAMYSVAFMVVMTVTMIPQSLGQAIMPLVAAASGANEHAGLNRHLSTAMRIALLLSLPATVYTAVLGHDLIVLLYGTDFERAGRLSPWLALMIIVVPTWRLCFDYLSGVARIRPILVTGTIAGVLDITVALLLIPQWGAFGAVLAKLVGQIIAGVLLIWVTCRGLDERRLFGPGFWPFALTNTISAGAGLWLVANLRPLVGVGAALLTVTAIIVVGSLVVRPLSGQDGRWIADMLPARFRGLVSLVSRSWGQRSTRKGASP